MTNTTTRSSTTWPCSNRVDAVLLPSSPEEAAARAPYERLIA
jgi:hypothetical protein